MENFEDPELPEIPVSQSTSGKMRFLGIKLKLFLTVAFLAAGFVAWELVSLKKVNRNYDLKDERGISVAPDLFEDTRRNISLSYGDVETRDFILTVANCSIPYVPIRGKVVSKKLRSHYDIPNCREPYGVQSSLNDNDELVISNADKYSSCCYAEITRPEHSKSDRYRMHHVYGPALGSSKLSCKYPNEEKGTGQDKVLESNPREANQCDDDSSRLCIPLPCLPKSPPNFELTPRQYEL
ncbi:unnamed protein product [Allacma fusca]|uniref:Uncharacterized protein n=1 Tax=Allacma fusca TaxID=39272 RepID=A0A8J2LDR4_9HEXA|nr:unnamed protein product [Allacma fusca]